MQINCHSDQKTHMKWYFIKGSLHENALNVDDFVTIFYYGSRNRFGSNVYNIHTHTHIHTGYKQTAEVIRKETGSCN